MTEWRVVFWISFVIFMVTTVVYVLWASGEVQPWNNPITYYAERNGGIAEFGKNLELTNAETNEKEQRKTEKNY